MKRLKGGERGMLNQVRGRVTGSAKPHGEGGPDLYLASEAVIDEF